MSNTPSNIALVNCSGSAGKTTSALGIAIHLTHRGLRVRLHDADPQANASRQTGYPDPHDQPTMAEILTQKASIADAERQARIPAGIDNGVPFFEDDDEFDIPGLTIVPAYRASLEEYRINSGIRGITRLRNAIQEAPPVDVNLIDAPGGFDVMTMQAILATQAFPEHNHTSGVIACTFPGPKEVEGILEVEHRLSEINDEYNVDAQLRSIIICNVPRKLSKLNENYIEALQGKYAGRVPPVVHYNLAVSEAYHNYMPALLYASTADQRRITTEYGAVVHFLEQDNGLFPQLNSRASL
ncbi:ATPase involved in chromosome partitioning [Mycobacteroides abscessus subsp. abscessus]|uniref:ParA family protein n=1 Tax=Mycobacteroides abscessus TaxID=36809 RepID=UPI00092ACECB|nr:ParA family protein [Mycobacteroides abscessus]SIC60160.1 ATPase involved in chromosome partitioning [Mycobacteroides abscessus subsp. abscessus]SIC92311.1 ATPase involved in chromosome partitioning [Mycobacteroides abscessus subsp. abscessus]SID12029.1 ATPase involved in chromosome partitioning [Mycobacteroides abscessus subsp. abscessus]SID17070.1 ATPase involved in chromosome partitioning [Mycobacteroides abscessus subsp. abscessus]SKV99491.1 ATPase involved in chromosome partitioning [M